MLPTQVDSSEISEFQQVPYLSKKTRVEVDHRNSLLNERPLRHPVHLKYKSVK
jgi:hypothetical protein